MQDQLSDWGENCFGPLFVGGWFVAPLGGVNKTNPLVDKFEKTWKDRPK